MITEVRQGLGDWSIRLRETTPREILDVLDAHYFGHIAVLPGRHDVKALGDAMLATARYVGVYRKRFNQSSEEYEIKGDGMSFWLGDSDNRGDLISTNLSFSASTFAQTMRALLPSSGSVIEGTFHSIGGSATFTGSVRWDTPRDAMTRICTYFTSDATDPVEWKVNTNGTLDAGKVSSLYPSSLNPTAILVRRRESGRDLATTSLAAKLSLDSSVEDYITHTYVIGEGEGDAVPVGSASAAPTPYRTLFGTPVRMAEVLNDPDAGAAEVNTVAAIALANNDALRRASQISTDEYDVKGTFGVGDTIMVFDPEAGFTDPLYEIHWQGQPINPIRLRCVELTWPIPAGWTVAFRDANGAWYDLSNFYASEAGATHVVIGDFLKRLSGAFGTPLNGRATPDSSVPGVPTFGTFYSGTYQSLAGDDTKAQIQVQWTRPLNTDSSTIVDLHHYDLRYRPITVVPYPATHAEMATKTYAQLLTHAQPLVPPLVSQWHHITLGPDVTQFTVQELSPGVSYDFQIRAVDTASPPNVGAWSATTTFQAERDRVAPNQPAPPSVAGSRVAIQVTHTLGSSSGGTFNLAADLDHLEVHVGGGPSFECDDSTRVGKLIANAGMLAGQIPAVGTFPIEPTGIVHVRVKAVDRAGNKSSPSDAATVTALLMDDAHISDLTVSKVTAGTVTASWVIAGELKTAESGARVVMNATGVQAYDTSGEQTFDVSAATGAVTTTGVFQTGLSGQRIVITDAEPISTLYFYGSRLTDDGSGDFAFINAPDTPIEAGPAFVGLGFNTSQWVDPNDGTNLRTRLYMHPAGAALQIIEAATQIPRGGAVQIGRDFASIGFAFPDGNSGNDQLWSMQSSQTVHYGTWADFLDLGADAGLFTGTVAGTNGASSLSLSYGTTATSQRPPIVSIRDNQSTANVRGFQVGASDTTGFTVDLSGTANGAWSVYFWNFRI
jgi:hypothetical protein